jgi:hypothetical protein
MLGGTVLDRVSSINNLGVIMNEKITFSEHEDVDVIYMVAKAFAMLQLIRSFSLEFKDPYTLKSLYHVSGSCKTGIRKLRVESVL